jgi:hypothetical protein
VAEATADAALAEIERPRADWGTILILIVVWGALALPIGAFVYATLVH